MLRMGRAGSFRLRKRLDYTRIGIVLRQYHASNAVRQVFIFEMVAWYDGSASRRLQFCDRRRVRPMVIPRAAATSNGELQK